VFPLGEEGFEFFLGDVNHGELTNALVMQITDDVQGASVVNIRTFRVLLLLLEMLFPILDVLKDCLFIVGEPKGVNLIGFTYGVGDNQREADGVFF
jgi:hypothetical protein